MQSFGVSGGKPSAIKMKSGGGVLFISAAQLLVGLCLLGET